ncbi:MAG TPA: amidohydrolase [Candidatus Marinimicrobia bacterium]|nr:amidohydrolase [Candidatus Neomarinimicrobiota bacterium]
MRIDIHTHILPKEWPDLKKKYGYGGWIHLDHHKTGCARMMKDNQFFREVESNLWDPEIRGNECDNYGIDIQVLSTVPVMFSYWAKPEHGLDLSKLLNDHIASIVADQPRRFIGLGTLPMQEPSLAVSELERCVKELGLVGVQIGTNINGMNLSDDSLFEVFESAESLNAAIFIHPWYMMGEKDMIQYWLPWLVGMPAEISRAICSMIFGGIFERLPNLRVAFAHGGGAFPATIGRIDHGFSVRPDLCAVDNDKLPSTYLGKFWVDSLLHDRTALSYIISKVGMEKIALGTDYPFPLGELEPGSLIDEMENLSADNKDMLYCRNALNWLGLDNNSFLK